MPVEPQILDVYLKENFVGELISNNSTLSFVYDKTYLDCSNAIKLSASMPLCADVFNHAIVAPFFSGLLPDEGVRYRLAQCLRLSENNIFGLLKIIGGECAGAVSVHPKGTVLNQYIKSSYRILEESEANEILSSLDKMPLLAGEEDIRMSGAGAQDKLMILIMNNKIAIPTHNTPSTHIIKPVIKGFDYSVHNEFFCMQLAKSVKLPVPEVSIYWLNEKPYYLIERYDRRLQKDGSIIRLHQEDFCQAFHVPPEIKYEKEGGPTLEQCFSLLAERISSGFMAGRNKITLFRGVLFNYLIGNGDAHGKNFSLLYEGNAESLAPFYDLLSTAVYGDAHRATMAMKIGRHYRFRDIYFHHWEQFGEKIGFRSDFVEREIKNMCHAVEKNATSLMIKFNNNERTASPVYERIINIITINHQRIIK